MVTSERGQSATERLLKKQQDFSQLHIRISAGNLNELADSPTLRGILSEHRDPSTQEAIIPVDKLRLLVMGGAIPHNELSQFANAVTQELVNNPPQSLIRAYDTNGATALGGSDIELLARAIELHEAAAVIAQELHVTFTKPSGEVVISPVTAQSYLAQQQRNILKLEEIEEQVRRAEFADQPTQVVSVVRPAITPVLSAVTVTPLEDAEKNNPGAEWADGQTRTPQRPGLRRLLHE